MKLLPDIQSIEHGPEGVVTLYLRIAPELHYFPHHFPGYPLLPGVVQLDWAVRFGQAFLNVQGEFCRMDNIKFQAIVLPAQLLTLHLEWDRDSGRLSFSYTHPTGDHSEVSSQTFSSGTIIFAGAA